MSAIELTAKSLEDAAKNAAEKLGVDKSQVKITILSESKGLFGKTNYTVRAEVDGGTAAAAPAEKAAEKPAAKRTLKKAEAPAEPAAEAATTEATPKKLGRTSKKKEDVAPVAAPAASAEAPAADATPAAESEEPEVEVIATEADAEKILAIASNVLSKSGLNASVNVASVQGKYINLSLDGKEASYFVGKQGEVVNALQYLFNLMAKQNLPAGVRVSLDANDYRQRREEQLTALAVKIAAEVKKRGEEAVLDALPAFERRVIHRAVQEMEGIETYSEGEEPNRRVVIAPAE